MTNVFMLTLEFNSGLLALSSKPSFSPRILVASPVRLLPKRSKRMFTKSALILSTRFLQNTITRETIHSLPSHNKLHAKQLRSSDIIESQHENSSDIINSSRYKSGFHSNERVLRLDKIYTLLPSTTLAEKLNKTIQFH